MIGGDTIWPQIDQASAEVELMNVIDFLAKGTIFPKVDGALFSR